MNVFHSPRSPIVVTLTALSIHQWGPHSCRKWQQQRLALVNEKHNPEGVIFAKHIPMPISSRGICLLGSKHWSIPYVFVIITVSVLLL